MFVYDKWFARSLVMKLRFLLQAIYKCPAGYYLENSFESQFEVLCPAGGFTFDYPAVWPKCIRGQFLKVAIFFISKSLIKYIKIIYQYLSPSLHSYLILFQKIINFHYLLKHLYSKPYKLFNDLFINDEEHKK